MHLIHRLGIANDAGVPTSPGSRRAVERTRAEYAEAIKEELKLTEEEVEKIGSALKEQRAKKIDEIREIDGIFHLLHDLEQYAHATDNTLGTFERGLHKGGNKRAVHELRIFTTRNLGMIKTILGKIEAIISHLRRHATKDYKTIRHLEKTSHYFMGEYDKLRRRFERFIPELEEIEGPPPEWKG